MRRAVAVWLALALAAGAARAQSLPWFDDGGPRPEAHAAVALLADAASHGLNPQDYGVAALRQALARASPASASAVSTALTGAMRRYLQDLRHGRLPAGALVGVPMQREPFDADELLRATLALGDPALAVQVAAPALAPYEQLRQALAHVRALDGHAAWLAPLPAWPSGKRAVEPGASWSGLGRLAQRLAAWGDLEPSAVTAYAGPQATLDPRLVAALRAFQARHGLLADGVLGRATRDALEVTPSRRAVQIALTLERLRWTPLRRAERMVVVNLPEFVLRAYEVQGDRLVVRTAMKVIVGHALDTRTPLIEEPLRRIEFKPYWNVPRSIAQQELVPRLRRDRAHWSREGFEFVGPAGIETRLDEARLQAVLDGRLRIRQRPGPRNALGDIKFVFPNRETIYLHHTPSTRLFDAQRRDFSHGCIRVQEPVTLAAFVLQGEGGWDEARIRAAMGEGARPSTVTLATPLPVLLTYATALVKGGQLHFFADLYGHDAELERALRRPAPDRQVGGRSPRVRTTSAQRAVSSCMACSNSAGPP